MNFPTDYLDLEVDADRYEYEAAAMAEIHAELEAEEDRATRWDLFIVPHNGGPIIIGYGFIGETLMEVRDIAQYATHSEASADFHRVVESCPTYHYGETPPWDDALCTRNGHSVPHKPGANPWANAPSWKQAAAMVTAGMDSDEADMIAMEMDQMINGW